MEEELAKIRLFIGEDETASAITILNRLLQKSNKLDEVILQAARKNRIDKQIRSGIIKIEDADITQNQINNALLEICRAIEKHREREGEDGFDILRSKNINGLTCINNKTWRKTKTEIDYKYLANYYLKTFSSRPDFMIKVISSNYCVRCDHYLKKINKIFDKNSSNKLSLIKVLSRGGEGKTTFLYQIAREYCKQYNIIFFEKITKELLVEISKTNFEKKNIIIIDSIFNHYQELVDLKDDFFSSILKSNTGAYVIIGERFSRYNYLSNIDSEFEYYFESVDKLEFDNSDNLKQIMKKFNEAISFSNEMAPLNKIERKELELNFLKDKRESVAEKIYKSLKYLLKKGKINYKFDWQEWDEITKDEKLTNFKDLYLLVSSFYQFGIPLPLDSLVSYKNNPDFSRIFILKLFSKNTENYPIYFKDNFFYLRHERLSEWFIEYEKLEIVVKEIIQHFVIENNNSYGAYLLLKVYRNQDFLNCPYLQVVREKITNNLLIEGKRASNYRFVFLFSAHRTGSSSFS